MCSSFSFVISICDHDLIVFGKFDSTQCMLTCWMAPAQVKVLKNLRK